MKRWAVFISGRGSNLVHAFESGMDVRLIVTNRKTAAGVAKAQRRGIPVLFFNGNWVELVQDLKRYRINSIFLLGFMRLLPADFLVALAKQADQSILNLHPSLLPAFPGLHAIETSYANGAPMGVTVHDVIAEMDAGTIRVQRKVGCETSDLESLEFAKLMISREEARAIRKVAGWA